MGLRNLFCILGGILVILSTYFLTFGQFGALYFYGIGLILNIGNIFATADALAIIIGIVFILFALSGLFILIGVKSRFLAIFGSLLAILVSTYFILIYFVDLPVEMTIYSLFFLGTPLVDGIIPYHVAIATVGGLAPFIVLGGGILGLTGGIMSKKD